MTFMLRPLVSVTLLLTLAGCSRNEDVASAEMSPGTPRDISDIANNYNQLKLMTKEGVQVDPELAALCRGASQSDVDEARKKFGPHTYTVVHIFMNDLAANAFEKSTNAYPVGAIIVKEKKGQPYTTNDSAFDAAKSSDGIGGMIKRPVGFDPKHGDWEYFYFEDPKKIESGQIKSCVQCHSAAAAKDYVFGSWATADKAR